MNKFNKTVQNLLIEARSRGTIEEVETRQGFFKKMEELRQQYSKATIYFHQDLDGVATAIAMRELLRQGGFQVVSAEYIQYGSAEFAVRRPENGVMPVLVDFAHGKPMFKIHTDHHDSQAGAEETDATYFPQARSNAETISGILSPEDIFPKGDIDIIQMVDSADFLKNKVTPDDVMSFIYSPTGDATVDKRKLGLVVNKLLLTYKNQDKFLSYLVMNASPSLSNIYLHIKKFAKKNPGKYAGGGKYVTGFADPEMLKAHQTQYIERRRKEVSYLEEYQIAYQSGGGDMFLQGSYDRYIPFKLYPDAEFLVTGWEMGLVQASCNPFKDRRVRGVNLGETKDKILDKFKKELSNLRISLRDIKMVAESSSFSKKFPDSIGFTSTDLHALFNMSSKSNPEGVGRKVILRALDAPFISLSNLERDALSKVTLPLYDIIVKHSGGHKCITNMSGFEFIVDNSTREYWITRILNNFLLELAKLVSGEELSVPDIRAAMSGKSPPRSKFNVPVPSPVSNRGRRVGDRRPPTFRQGLSRNSMETFRHYYKNQQLIQEAAIDKIQTALDIVGLEPTIGSVADGANTIISGLRAAFSREKDSRKKHLINMGISAVSLVPFADVIKLLKLRKLGKGPAKAGIATARAIKKSAKEEKALGDRFSEDVEN